MADSLVGLRAVHWVASMVEPTADLMVDLRAVTTVGC